MQEELKPDPRLNDAYLEAESPYPRLTRHFGLGKMDPQKKRILSIVLVAMILVWLVCGMVCR